MYIKIILLPLKLIGKSEKVTTSLSFDSKVPITGRNTIYLGKLLRHFSFYIFLHEVCLTYIFNNRITRISFLSPGKRLK